MKEEIYPKTQKEKIILERINPVVRFLTISDILVLGGFGLLSPIFAVFITGQISGATVETVGIAEGLYLLARSLTQIPFGRLIDKIKGEKDDFWFLFIGTLLLSFIPIAYIFCDTPLKLYAAQFVYGIVSGATLPTWLAIFTRHIDRDREGLEWGIYQTSAGLSGAIFASLGGFVAASFGFDVLFVIVAVLSSLGALFLLGVYSKMRSGGVFKTSNS
jgi:MFS family permease